MQVQASTRDEPTAVSGADRLEVVTTPTPPTAAHARPRRGRHVRPGRVRSLVRAVPVGLEVNALALVVSTVVTGVFGLLFWVLAARMHPAETVGRASAVVSLLTLLATIAQLNLTNVLVRFLPVAGRHTRRLVGGSLALLVVTCCLVAVGYVWTGLGRHLFGDPTVGGVGALAPAVVTLALFTVLDAVLTGIRRAVAVPVKNLATASGRLLLIPVLAGTGGALTVLATAWVLPAMVAVVVCLFVVLPRLTTPSDAPSGLPGPRTFASFVTAEYVMSLCTVAAAQSLPLIVAARLGLEETAWFQVPWLICSSISLLLWNLSTSFVVEAAHTPARTWALFVRTVRLDAIMVVPVTVVLVLGAPLVMAVLGPEYAAGGTDLLRLIGASAPFTAVTVAYACFAWLDQRLWWLVVVQGTASVLLLTLSVLLIPTAGVTGVGLAYLIAQALMALLMTPALVRRIRTLRTAARAEAAGTAQEPVRRGPDVRTLARAGWTRVGGDPRGPAALGALVAAVLLTPAVLLLSPGDPRVVATVLVLVLGPGLGIACHVRAEAAMVWSVAVVSGIVTSTLLTYLLLWTRWWHPETLLLLVVPAAIGALVRLLLLVRPLDLVRTSAGTSDGESA